MAPVSLAAEPGPSVQLAPAARQPVNRAYVAAVIAGLAVVYLPTIVWLFSRWTMSVWHHAHGLFIPPLVAWLIVQELRRRRVVRYR